MHVRFHIVDEEDSGLHALVKANAIDEAVDLIISGVNLEYEDENEQTALDVAIELQNIGMVSMLLYYDARINDRDKLYAFLQTQDANDPNVIECKSKLHVTLSYIWIGDSTTKGIPGQDTQAVIVMSKSIDPKYNRIFFWVLEKDLSHYTEIFKESHVTVLSVENELHKLAQNDLYKADVAKINRVLEVSLSPERNTRRSRTNLKNILAFGLLKMQLTDFVMDTNVGPAPNSRLNLHKHNSFHMPCIYNQEGMVGVDVWAMYAPPGDALIQSAFLHYYEGWETLELYYDREGDSESYRKNCGQLVVDAVRRSAEATQDGKINQWNAISIYENRSAMIVPELGIRKYYENTHKYIKRSEYETEESLLRQEFVEILKAAEQEVIPGANRSAYSYISVYGFFPTKVRNLIYDYTNDASLPEKIRQSSGYPVRGSQYSAIFSAAFAGDVEKINQLIRLGDDINQVLTAEEAKGQTPLHVAIENLKLEAVEELLKHHARVDLEYDDGTQKMNALQYIHICIPENKRKEYLDVYYRYHPDVPKPTLKNRPTSKSI